MTERPTRQVSVVPDTFAVIEFDAALIADAVRTVADHVGLPATDVIRVEVDESSMLSLARIASDDPIVIAADSGAFEDRARPRWLSPDNLIDELARLLQRVADRRSPAFAAAPAEAALTPQERAAWDVHCLGRTAAWQQGTFRSRHRYDFAIACGFTTEATIAFDALWTTVALDWAEVAALIPVPRQ